MLLSGNYVCCAAAAVVTPANSRAGIDGEVDLLDIGFKVTNDQAAI